MHRVITFLAITSLAWAISCDPDIPEYQRGDPSTAVVTLDETHPGWGSQACTSCHSGAHYDYYEVEQCSICHGGNGGEVVPATHDTPQVEESHTGWQRADCGACHSLSGTHDGAFSAPACGVCHGGNGAPERPQNHWLTNCNDCHAAGPEPWNSCTHTGYEPDAPRACRYCHR